MKTQHYCFETLPMTQQTAVALLGAYRATGRKPESLAIKILATHAPNFRRRAEAGDLIDREGLQKKCLGWLSEIGLDVDDLAKECAARFAKEFADCIHGLGHLRSLFLGGVADGQRVVCTGADGRTWRTDLSNPEVLDVLRAGGSARLGKANLKVQAN